jgi:hypothetical protein
VTARNQGVFDLFARRAGKVSRREYLLLGRDVIRLACQKVEWAGDVMQGDAAAERNKLPAGQLVLPEQEVNLTESEGESHSRG